MNYIGLLIGSAEPAAATGYTRAEGSLAETVAFPTAQAEYGYITAIAVYDNAEGGEPLETVELAEPVHITEGIIPIVRDRALLRGVDVTAHVKINAKELFVL